MSRCASPARRLGTRCEIKNVNSIRFIGQAIEHEARRQIEIIEDGGTIEQETRLFDPDKGETRSMRSKEEAHDYRYFPGSGPVAARILAGAGRRAAAEPAGTAGRARRRASCATTRCSAYDADVLVAEREMAEYFEAVVSGARIKRAPRTQARRQLGDQRTCSDGSISEGNEIAAAPVSAEQLGAILDLIGEGTISGKIAKDVFEIVWIEGGDPRAIVEQRGLKQVTDLSAIEKIVDDIVAKHPDKVADAKTNPKAIGWFVGQVMKASGGKANPQAVNDLLKKKLGL